ncbi:ATP phosphoribosyltransferase regulatory subunit [Methylovirgula sp. 4M-Z18]|uniref:ATP phosphoribosyltransferase regulatory subunit n=1 Tax=Methylovirgula sp. 4M-Z18 TaxID=2293567 RepID=UPI000E2FC9A5|nr:ATP phosphoribosyltransferase regulatory subunit [Methylovirgula sp. 4M-Z18]RFB78359.1 ATP phosphoribosyltransferase regulatory subunit [Methylovirgula sp. 4M-Z18]
MTTRPTPTNPSSLETRLLAFLEAAHFTRVEPSILQPASVFLDLSGEDIRGRLYLTSDIAGAELCLRPEYTIPVSRDYLSGPMAGQVQSVSYLGPVFRMRVGEGGEFLQAGIESYGRMDREAADAEILTAALDAVHSVSASPLMVRFGDAGLFARLLEVMGLAPVWLRRIKRGFAQGKTLETIAQANGTASSIDHSGVLAALAGSDKQGARALVEDLLSIAGISSVGGRSAGEIAERFLEQATLKSGGGLDAEKQAILAKFLSVAGDAGQSSARLRALAGEAKLDLSEALDAFDARINFLAARGCDMARLSFAASFARNLDYYTGFVFEAHDPQRADRKPIIGGGRYDGLLKALGAQGDVPAVGAAIWIERIAGA